MKALVIEIEKEDNKLKMSAFERIRGIDSTIKHHDECISLEREIQDLCEEIAHLFSKFLQSSHPDNDFLEDLKKIGCALFDHLFTDKVKKTVKNSSATFLVIAMNEYLVNIPWELLHDGKEFLCIRFAVGRIVKTKQESIGGNYREINRPAKMLVIGDPGGDLEYAYKEGIGIRKALDKWKNKVKIISKTGETEVSFVKRNIRDYDIVHFAGHAKYDLSNPHMGGWILKDNIFTAKDIVSLGTTAPMPSVVFSNACQSGKTQEWEVKHGFEEEVYGLANAFLLSGVRNYIGTFWNVADDTCLEFAREFYRHIVEEKPIGEALRLSRLHLIHIKKKSSLAWASYMLYGDPTINIFAPGTKNKRKIRKYIIYLVLFISILIPLSIRIKASFSPISISVLNLSDLDEGKKNWGLSHAVTVNLNRIPNINAIDATSLVKLDDLNQKTIKELGKVTGIRLAVMGQYKREGERIKVNLVLENPLNGKVYESKQFEVTNDLELEGVITNNVVSMLKVHIPEKDAQGFKRSSTNNVMAYRIFSKTWELFLASNYDEAILLCKQALELDPEYADVYKRLGNIYDVKGDRSLALSTYLEYIRLSEKKGDIGNLANALINAGWIYHGNGEYPQAFELYNKGLIKAVEANNKLYEAKAYRQLGTWYTDKGKYDQAESFLLKSMMIDAQNSHIYDYKYNLACDYQGLGILYSYKEDYKKALRYFLKSMNIFKSLNAEKQLKWVTERISDKISDNYTCMGDVYFEKGEYDKSMDYYQKGLEIDKIIGWQEGLAGDYRSLGEVYAAKGEFDKALIYYSKSLEIFSATKDEVGLGGVYRALGKLHSKKGAYDIALNYFKQALVIYEKAGFPEVEEIKAEIAAIELKKNVK